MQMQLFDNAKRARKADPDTSKKAADKFDCKASEAMIEFVEGVRIWCITKGTTSATANEAASSTNKYRQETVRKRGLECVKRGLCVYGEKRRCEITGQFVNTYKVN